MSNVRPISRRAGMWNWMSFLNHPLTWNLNLGEINPPRRLTSKEKRHRKVRNAMQRESRRRNRANWY